jgi:hypothetical protein
MEKVIKSLEADPFSGSDILKICDNETKILKYGDISKFQNIDQLLEPHGNVVILYEIKPNFGHWVCLIKHDDCIEFFDPYGMRIDEQRKYISDYFRKKSNQQEPWLTNLLKKDKCVVINNRQKLQKFNNDISTCGRHVAMRIVMRNIGLNKYLNLLTRNKETPDKIVTYLTAFIK